MTVGDSSNLLPQASPFNTTKQRLIQAFLSVSEIGITRFFLDHQLFDTIPVGSSIAVSEIADKHDIEKGLLDRFCYFLISIGVLSSPAPGHIAHTEVSRGYRAGSRESLFFEHFFSSTLVPIAHWPEYFERHGPAEPNHPRYTPMAHAFGHSGKTVWEVLETRPKEAKIFNHVIALATEGMPITGMYDFHWVEKYASSTADRPLIVDVGGGKGQALEAIFNENPGIPPARCVLQDRPDVIEDAKSNADSTLMGDVVKQAYDFFEEQPTKGALIYHIRRVLNDWPDRQCLQILRNARAACALDSKVLVSEQLLPEEPTPYVAGLDIFFMCIGGKRRSEEMMAQLALKASLKVQGVFKHPESDMAVIEMVPV